MNRAQGCGEDNLRPTQGQRQNHWDWYNSVAGRAYQLRVWDCFQLLLDGQAALGMGRAFEPVYRDRASKGVTAGGELLRNFARGFACFKRVETPVPGAAVLFREEGVPIHVGFWMAPFLMAHTNTHTATTLAEFGPGTDYHFAFDGYYVPA